MASTLTFSMLPEDCVSNIISFTSPADACKSVSSFFTLAAESDLVWEKFLPTDYLHIVQKSVIPLEFSSRKELFLRLSESTIIDGGRKSFSLDTLSAKKSYIISARELSIFGSNDPTCWSWNPNPDSRFLEVAELKTTSDLKIHCTLNTEMLSQNTKYGAYILIKIPNGAYGLDAIPSELSIKVGDHEVTSTAYLSHNNDSKRIQMLHLLFANRLEMLKKRVVHGEERAPQERKDGWLEIELGEFYSGERNEEVKMSLVEAKGHQLKGGLVVEGIEVRPKHKLQ
ncbi:putative SKP1 interacting partner 3-related family protein [Heracleum sosnowskyi]|uniref:SKP1 interacting partner 3-related family protein n=1 Tax=Heracleum sosnowskyi TaxID=360622 RepID=A0AAD8MXM0_9APIA|nr:putative SKP1 interacting partner 3-related family protein [Heracleum sosnowskyi]